MATKRIRKRRDRSKSNEETAQATGAKAERYKAEQLALLDEIRENREAIRRRIGRDFDVLEAIDEAREGLL